MMYDVNKLPLEKLVGMPMDVRSDIDDLAPAPYFIADNILYLDCESGIFVADYYCEFGMEFHPKIEEWAKDNGGYWEWVNPGCVMFCVA